MTVEAALMIIDAALKPEKLNNLQELIFRQSCEGKSYQEIAASSGYNPEYIKDVGYKLWQLISKALGEKITKSNCRSILRLYAQQIQVLASSSDATDINFGIHQSLVSGQQLIQNPTPKSKVELNWGEAIYFSIFYGCTEELATLAQWIVTDHCRMVALLGMGGIGKTVLAVRLAEQVQNEFE